MSSEEKLALTPALTPWRGGTMHSAWEFSPSLVWLHLTTTHVGGYFLHGLLTVPRRLIMPGQAEEKKAKQSHDEKC